MCKSPVTPAEECKSPGGTEDVDIEESLYDDEDVEMSLDNDEMNGGASDIVVWDALDMLDDEPEMYREYMNDQDHNEHMLMELEDSDEEEWDQDHTSLWTGTESMSPTYHTCQWGSFEHEVVFEEEDIGSGIFQDPHSTDSEFVVFQEGQEMMSISVDHVATTEEGTTYTREGQSHFLDVFHGIENERQTGT